MRQRPWRLALLFVTVFAIGCGDNQEAAENQDEAGARSLLARVQAEGYRTWDRAPGYETRRPSRSAHSAFVDIYVNDRVAEVLALAEPRDSWPQGSIIVKDGFAGSELALIAVMEKRADGWYWAEYDSNGNADYSGQPEVCTGCHRSGSDYVRAFSLPTK
jgi:hypothetical protein